MPPSKATLETQPPSESSALTSKPGDILEEGWAEEDEEWDEEGPFPNLMTQDPLLDDIAFTEELPAGPASPYHNRIIFRNENPLGGKWDEEPPEEKKTDSRFEFLDASKMERSQWHEYILIFRRVTQQTGKGKKHRMSAVYVVGNGNGLLGFGMASDAESSVAHEKALAQAYRNVDYVDRMENRTLWTEMESKLGSTKVILRPRPVGFGLRCNPYIHYILKAAGIKDASAKVWGSRTPMNVINTTLRMLWAGNAPLAMGNGIGGPTKRLMKGSGMRSAEDVERERGRKMVSLRT